MSFDFLKKKPYYLSDQDIDWVRNTISGMSMEEKVGQLFCLIAYSDNNDYLNALTHHYHIGGLMGRPMPLNEICDTIGFLQRESKVPMLIAANFEAGGDGMIQGGTNVGPNMMIGATGDATFAQKQGEVCAREGSAVGANWAFAPVIDIENNFRNPITATRVFSSDPKLVREMGKAYTLGAQGLGMAVSIKHFPGDGVDERDQHLVTSINSLSCEEWDATYGEAYKASIDAGALTVMVGHIMQPAYSKKLRPEIKDEDIMPATLAPELLNDLLRQKLEFNGMIVTDATTMAGMCIPMKRSELVPYTIAAGCDMFLFTKNLDEDFAFMRRGIEDGRISPERLEDALARILGVKAALKLHQKQQDGTLIPDPEKAKEIVGCPAHLEIEKQVADVSVTLVKNKEGLIPLDVKKHKRILLYPILSGESAFGGGGEDVAGIMKAALEKEGFEVDVFEAAKGFEGMLGSVADMESKYDLLMYAGNMSTKSNQTTVRIEWAQPMGANCPVYIQSIPTMFISFANPFHLIDVPRIKTFINAYKFKPATVNAVVDKLLGRSEFVGQNPTDPFLGMWDTRL